MRVQKAAGVGKRQARPQTCVLCCRPDLVPALEGRLEGAPGAPTCSLLLSG